jgi:hypothetical protein
MKWARSAKHGRKSRRGQSAFEFALAVPIFMAFICVIIDISFYYYLESTMSHVVRSTLRDAVVGRHHRDLDTNQSPREKLIDLMKEHAKVGADFVEIVAGETTYNRGDTVVITPEDCYNSNEFITIELRHEHHFMTPVGTFMALMTNTENDTKEEYNIVVRTTYRSEIFNED